MKKLSSLRSFTRVHFLELALFVLASASLFVLLPSMAWAQFEPTTEVDMGRLEEALQILFAYIEGSFGALVMVSAGIGALLSAAFGQYRATLSLLVVAVGSFVLRSFVTTFFDTQLGN